MKDTIERDFDVVEYCDKGCVVTNDIRDSITRLGSTGLIRRGTKVEILDNEKMIIITPTAKATTAGKQLAKI